MASRVTIQPGTAEEPTGMLIAAPGSGPLSKLPLVMRSARAGMASSAATTISGGPIWNVLMAGTAYADRPPATTAEGGRFSRPESLRQRVEVRRAVGGAIVLRQGPIHHRRPGQRRTGQHAV